MAWRFQKRIRIAPGLRVNISKSGLSLTGGVKGASVTSGKDGQHLNLGLPGSGLSTRTRLGKGQGGKSTASFQTSKRHAKPSLGAKITAWFVLLGLLAFLIALTT